MSDDDLFSAEYLVERPLLAAVRHAGPKPAVLLIDEIDRADDEFEALLLEFLGEHSVTVPELGTIRAQQPPVVILTSNRSRELHDALKRRCLYHWIDYPSTERASKIVRRNVPSATEPLIAAATAFVGRARDLDLDKPPGLAETIDWVSALNLLGVSHLATNAEDTNDVDTNDQTASDRADAAATVGALAKTPDDLTQLRAALMD